MNEFPQLPKIIDNQMSITKKVEIEIAYEDQYYVLGFEMCMDVTFDEETKEVTIDCQEKRNVH